MTILIIEVMKLNLEVLNQITYVIDLFRIVYLVGEILSNPDIKSKTIDNPRFLRNHPLLDSQ